MKRRQLVKIIALMLSLLSLPIVSSNLTISENLGLIQEAKALAGSYWEDGIEVTVGGIRYVVSPSINEAKTAEGSFDTLSGSVVIPDTIEYNGKDVPVTRISLYSAYPNGGNCMTDVHVGDNVKVIEDGAFYGCDKLTKVTGCKNVEKIGESAFFSCDLLSNIELGNKLKKIGREAFYCCESLSSIDLPDTVEEVGYAWLMSTATNGFKLNDKLKTCSYVSSSWGGSTSATIKYMDSDYSTLLAEYCCKKYSNCVGIFIPTKVGKIFKGWNSVDSLINVNGRITVYATWEEREIEKLEAPKLNVSKTLADNRESGVTFWLNTGVKNAVINNPSSGFDNEDSVEISLSGLTPSATYYYTEDGSEPTISSSKVVGNTINVDCFAVAGRKFTLKVKGFKNGESSDTISANIVISALNIKEPQINSNIDGNNLNLNIEEPQDKVTYYYTLDGTEPMDEYGTINSKAIKMDNGSSSVDISSMGLSGQDITAKVVAYNGVMHTGKIVNKSIYIPSSDDIEIDGILYKKYDDHYTAKRLIDMDKTELNIEDSIQGLKVTEVETNFSENNDTKITKITGNIKKLGLIGGNMPELTSVDLPYLEEIRSSQFSGTKLSGNVKFDSVRYLNNNAFDNTSINRLYLPKLEEIKTMLSFRAASSIEYLDVSSLVKTAYAPFDGLINLKVLYLNSGITTFKEYSLVHSEIAPEAIKLTGDYSSVIETAIANWGIYNKQEDSNGVKWYVRSGCSIPTTDYSFK